MLDPNGTLGITARSIERFVREGRLPRIKLGRTPGVREDHLTKLLRENEQWFRSTSQGSERETGPASSVGTSKANSMKSRQTRLTRDVLVRLGINSPRNSGNVHDLDAARLSRK